MSGQTEVANPPLREALELASKLPAIELPSGMLAEAMHCYEISDAELAKQLDERDVIVNRLNKELFRSTVALSAANQNSNELAFDYHTTVRYIERIADRSVKIAEFVHYEVTGYRFLDKK